MNSVHTKQQGFQGFSWSVFLFSFSPYIPLVTHQWVKSFTAGQCSEASSPLPNEALQSTVLLQTSKHLGQLEMEEKLQCLVLNISNVRQPETFTHNKLRCQRFKYMNICMHTCWHRWAHTHTYAHTHTHTYRHLSKHHNEWTVVWLLLDQRLLKMCVCVCLCVT